MICALVLRICDAVGGIGTLKTLVAPPLKRTCAVIKVRSQGDVFEYQARHSLAVAVAGASIFPKAREVFGQRQDLRLLLLGESTVVALALFFVLLTGLFKLPVFFVPECFEDVGYQAVVRIDAHISNASLLGLVSSSFNVLTAQAIGLGQAVLQLLLDMEGHFQGQRAEAFDNEPGKRIVDHSTGDVLEKLFDILGHTDSDKGSSG